MYFYRFNFGICRKLEEYFDNVRKHIRIAWRDISFVFQDQLPRLRVPDRLIEDDDVYQTKNFLSKD